MVEVTPPQKGSRLSISVCCFVCGDIVPLSFVFGNGIRADYYGPSNFYRHMIRHTKPKSEPVTRSSKASTEGKTKRKLKGKRSRSGKKRRKNDTSSESEDSDAENVTLAKELSNNYLHESDDFIDDDVDDDELRDDDIAVNVATTGAAVETVTQAKLRDDVAVNTATRDFAAVKTVASNVAQAGPSTQTKNRRQLRKK